MGMVWAKSPFIAKTEDGGVVISDKEPYADDHEIVQRYPDFFITPELMAERGDGQTQSKVQIGNDGRRGRLK